MFTNKQNSQNSAAKIKRLLTKLSLEPHIEGGYFRRTYESAESIKTEHGVRSAATSIYYLLDQHNVSQWHRIKSTEHWFHHSGETLLLHTLTDQGVETHRLGSAETGELPTVQIPPNTWFAAELAENISFCLVSCMVFPGFDFADFELANRDLLIQQFPDHSEIIKRLTKNRQTII